MSKITVKRKDVFKLCRSGFRAPGCYVLIKQGETINSQPFLDQILICNKPASHAHVECIGQIVSSEIFDSIDSGDIGIISHDGSIRIILSRLANHNTVLVTERCDNLCLFCSQPPKIKDDSWLLTQAALAIAAFNSSSTIGISGGEPLLYKEDFINFLDFLIEYAPMTQLHILTNGKAFSDAVFAQRILARSHKVAMCFGVPLYSSLANVHDELVGSKYAFKETVKGIINAGNLGLSIEFRIIPTLTNFKQLPYMIEFVSRTFSNISQVSIMNLEAEGYARKNWNNLYAPPFAYSKYLCDAIKIADRQSLNTVLFNYPLCHLPIELHCRSVQSISDWKNYYPEECNLCIKKEACGGYFKSSQGHFHQSPKRICDE